jgi:hypothetical protein
MNYGLVALAESSGGIFPPYFDGTLVVVLGVVVVLVPIDDPPYIYAQRAGKTSANQYD